MHKRGVIGGWALLWLVFLTFGHSTAGKAQAYTESPHIFMIEAERCLHEPEATSTEDRPIRRQTGFRVKGIPGIITALHGIVDCESVIAVSESQAGDAFGDLEIVAVDIDRDVARLLPRDISDRDREALAQVGFEVALDGDNHSFTDLYLIGHPYGARAQYTTEQITLRQTSTDTLALLLSTSLTAKLRLRNSPNPDLDVVSIEGHLVPGHSGAPALNGMDQVVGVGNGGLGNEISWLIPWHKIHWQAYTTVWRRVNQLKKQNPSDIFFDVSNTLSTSGNYVVYSGRVLDDQGNFVDQARVVLDLKQESHLVYTDSEGKFEITAEAKPSLRGKIYIQVSGYSPLSRTVDLLAAQRQAGGEEFALSRTEVEKSYCDFGFRIIDANQNPISGASVRILYRLDVVGGVTNSHGEYRGELPCTQQNPRVSVEVTAKGYSQKEDYTLVTDLISIQLSISTELPTATPTDTVSATSIPTITPPQIPTIDPTSTPTTSPITPVSTAPATPTPTRSTILAGPTPTAAPISTATYSPLQLGDVSQAGKKVTLSWGPVAALAPGDYYVVIVTHGKGENWAVTDTPVWSADWLQDLPKNGGFDWSVAVCRGAVLGGYGANPCTGILAQSERRTYQWNSGGSSGSGGSGVCTPDKPDC